MSAKRPSKEKRIYWSGYEILVSAENESGKLGTTAVCPKCGLDFSEEEESQTEHEIIRRAYMRVMIHMKMAHNIPPEEDSGEPTPSEWMERYSNRERPSDSAP